MHKVKCLYCNKYFDADLEKTQKIGRRYAHLTCNSYETNMEEIIAYACNILGEKSNRSRIIKQVREYLNKDMTTEGIYLTLKYWFEIKKNDTSKANGGIGIVPYVYNDAKNYWNSFKKARLPQIDEEEVVITYKRRKKIRIGGEFNL